LREREREKVVVLHTVFTVENPFSETTNIPKTKEKFFEVLCIMNNNDFCARNGAVYQYESYLYKERQNFNYKYLIF